MMTELNDYISVTRKNCITNDNEGKMIKRNFVEIHGVFLVKIRDNTFNGAIGENVFEHINTFLEVVGPIKINKVSQDRFRLSIFPISLVGVAEIKADQDDDPDVVIDIFKIEGDLFEYGTPLCKAFNDFNYLFKIDTDLFTFDIQGIRTYEEYELNNTMTMDLEEPWLDNRLPGMVRVENMTYFQDHKWYEELADGKLKDETLMHKAKVEESWGNATPGMMKCLHKA
ncbi:hypothetical protein Tco_1419752 [Tanacetum coccineum]